MWKLKLLIPFTVLAIAVSFLPFLEAGEVHVQLGSKNVTASYTQRLRTLDGLFSSKVDHEDKKEKSSSDEGSKSKPDDSSSKEPSGTPSSTPSDSPSGEPSGKPSSKPSYKPSYKPSRKPSSKPNYKPSYSSSSSKPGTETEDVIDECQVDEDCPGIKICYKYVDWLKKDNVVSFCGCSGYEGRTGADCTDPGPGSIYQYIASGILLIIAATEFICCLILLFKLRQRKKLKFNPTAGTLTLAILATISMIMLTSSRIYETATPEGLTLTKNNGEHRIHEAFYVLIWSTTLSILFGVSAAMNVSLVWVHTAIETKAFRKSKGNFKKYFKIIIGLQCIWLTAAVVLVSISMEPLLVPLAFVYYVITWITYCIGRRKITKLMRSSSKGSSDKEQNPYHQMIRNIEITANMIYLSGIIQIIAGIAYYSLEMYDDDAHKGRIERPGQIDPSAICWSIVLLGILIGVGTIIWYLYACLMASTKTWKKPSRKTNAPNRFYCCAGGCTPSEPATVIQEHSTVQGTENINQIEQTSAQDTESTPTPSQLNELERNKSLYAY